MKLAQLQIHVLLIAQRCCLTPEREGAGGRSGTGRNDQRGLSSETDWRRRAGQHSLLLCPILILLLHPCHFITIKLPRALEDARQRLRVCVADVLTRGWQVVIYHASKRSKWAPSFATKVRIRITAARDNEAVSHFSFCVCGAPLMLICAYDQHLKKPD